MSEDEHPADSTDFPRAIGRPAARALAAAGLTTWVGLTGRTRAEVSALHGMGPKALGVLDAGLAERGLAWRAD